MSDKLHTKFGNAVKNKRGYYQITSRKEGNKGKLLHRLIYEDFWGVTLPRQISIHHKDGDTTNNCILNLEAITARDHQHLHHVGAKRSEETCRKIRSSLPQHSDRTKIVISKSRNTSGYFRVTKHKNKIIKQGYDWCYQYCEDGTRKRITSVDINKLKEKVLAKGLEWIEY